MALHLNVPKDAQARLASLVSVSNDGFEELVEFMQSRAQEFGSLAHMHEAASELKHCSAEAGDIVQAVMPLLVSHIAEGKSPSDVASAIVAAVKRNETRTVLRAAKDLARLKQRLTTLLSNSQLALKSKAMLLVGERPALLHEAKIVSDIRPIFGVSKSKAETIEACSILHTLVLTCIESGEYVKHYIALDSTDLKNLGETVDRAHKKESALSALIEDAKVAKIVIG